MTPRAQVRLEEVADRLERDGREDDAARLRRLRGRGDRAIAEALDELLHLESASGRVRERARAAQREIGRAA